MSYLSKNVCLYLLMVIIFSGILSFQVYSKPIDLNSNQKFDIVDTILSFKGTLTDQNEIDLSNIIDNLKILTGIKSYNNTNNVFISSSEFGKITFKYDESIDYQNLYLSYYILDSEYNYLKSVYFENQKSDQTIFLLPGTYYISTYSDQNKTVKEVIIESGQESLISSSDFGTITFKYDESIDYQNLYLSYYILDSEYNYFKRVSFENQKSDQTTFLLPGTYYISTYSDRNKTVKEVTIESGQESLISSNDFGTITFKYDESIDYQNLYLSYYILDSEYNYLKRVSFENQKSDQTIFLLPGTYYITIYSELNKTVKEVTIVSGETNGVMP